MSLDIYTILIRLTLALFMGALIGFERSYHGRPAGLRTHALVSTSTCLLMLLTSFQWQLLEGAPIDTIRTDPTRMAQGIMTGIGFLGAGVIIRENLTVRGLTTATSIWMTASIGLVVGLGFFSAGIVATIMTLAILNLFGWFEKKLPTYTYSQLTVRCRRAESISKEDLCHIVTSHNFRTNVPNYYLEDEGRFIKYQLTINTKNTENAHALADDLIANDLISEFSITPVGK